MLQYKEIGRTQAFGLTKAMALSYLLEGQPIHITYLYSGWIGRLVVRAPT